MNRDRIWTLMSRKLSEEATEAELTELEELLTHRSALEMPVQFIEEYWQLTTEADDEDFLEATFQLHTDILEKSGYYINDSLTETGSLSLEKPKYIPNRRRLLVMTASSVFFILMILTGFYFYNKSGSSITNKIATSEVSTKKGSRTKVQLPDGTTVWLNSSSKLTYDNQNFGKQIREVSLSGEAYFDVVKNKTKPFIIHTAKMDIKVLGTVFNVKCYPGEKTTETSLIHGSVEVSLKGRQEKILMKPNEKLIFTNEDKILAEKTSNNLPANSVTKNNSVIQIRHLTLYPTNNQIVETGWVQNKLVFTNETLEDVASKMQRWYSVTIIIKSEQLKKELLTGNFEKESIQQALKALQYTTRFNYKTTNDTITISK